jgi:hypothetical protein
MLSAAVSNSQVWHVLAFSIQPMVLPLVLPSRGVVRYLHLVSQSREKSRPLYMQCIVLQRDFGAETGSSSLWTA